MSTAYIGVEQKIRIPRIISRPILFIGTSVHFSSSPVFQIIAAIYLAQINKIEISLSHYLLTAFLTLIASCALAPIPSGSLVSLALVLNGLNIDQGQIGLLFSVDWLM